MKNMTIKRTLAAVIHFLTRFFCIFPIDKKKIVFEAYMGTQYSCNPKYICEYIDSNDKSYRLIWTYHRIKLDCKYEQVKRNSIGYFYHTLTAGTVIYNSGLNSLIRFRKHQIAINTWHGGGAYKKLTESSDNIYNRDNDFFISSSKMSSKYAIKQGLNFRGEILDSGLPRNDLLINFNEQDAMSIKERLHIGRKKCVLYAPTFRNNLSRTEFKLDYVRLMYNLEMKFGGEWIVLYRGHYHMQGASVQHSKLGGVINVTEYPDMQELLLITDILITDYSSSIWDFSFLNRPIFLYATDIQQYEKERSFYIDIHKWGFPICENNDDLEKAITNFENEKAIISVRNHHRLMGSYEKGYASKQVYEFIQKKISM